MDPKDFALLCLCSIPSVGPVTVRRLLSAFGGAQEIFAASERMLRQVEGISEKRSRAIREYNGADSLARTLEKLEAQDVHAVFQGKEGYPVALDSLGDDAPLALYVRGHIIEEDRFAVAIVGSRNASPYGRAVTGRIAADLGHMGLTVISGMARGIDTAAHRGVLESGGRTIGVLGSGIDVFYPAENRTLMEKTAAAGSAVISEFPPGTKPLRENFPRRNRLISGLSLGVLVVEAAKRSGSLITAGFALEQGRDVFAVPGNISSSTSQGANELLRQGAKLVTGAEDILEELAPQLKGFLRAACKPEEALDVNEEQRRLCEAMSGEPVHVDEISRASGVPVPLALGLLLELELKGVIKQMEGKRFYLS
ncbi:DNA-processing protein DprA [Nitrospirota bacterium]